MIREAAVDAGLAEALRQAEAVRFEVEELLSQAQAEADLARSDAEAQAGQVAQAEHARKEALAAAEALGLEASAARAEAEALLAQARGEAETVRLGAEALSQVWQMYSPNKALGMTGVRGAYAIAPLKGLPLAQTLAALAPSWPLGAYAVAMLTAWIEPEARQWLAGSRGQLALWKQAQIALLDDAGWRCLASDANYFCARAPQDFDEVLGVARLRESGIKLRETTSLGLPGHWRLSVQPQQAQRALLSVLRAMKAV